MAQALRFFGGIFLGLAAGLSAAGAFGADVTAVRSWRAPDNTRLVLDISAPVQYHISDESTPAQLIFEIDNSRSTVDAPHLSGNTGPVKSVHLLAHGTQLRLVIDLASEVNPKTFQLAPNEKYGQRLVIDLFDKNAVAVTPVEKAVQAAPVVPATAQKTPADSQPMPKLAPAESSAVAQVAPAAPTTGLTPSVLAERPVVTKPAPNKVPAVEKPVVTVAPLENSAANVAAGAAGKTSDKNAEKSVEKSVDKAAVRQSEERIDKPVAGRGRNIIIAIDAGHGGEDSGAIGLHGSYEKNVTLAIARDLQALFRSEPGITPYLTRDGDYFIPLQDRRQIARYKYKADIFISIHADSSPSRDARGASVFALSLKGANTATSRFARMLAERENRSDLIGGVAIPTTSNDDVLRNVLADMVVTGSLEHSLRMGHNILGELDQVGRLHGHNVEQAGFAVLKEPGMVSVLVETGFISNPDEEKHLTDKSYQEHIARAVFEGARRYCEQYPVPGTYFAWLADHGHSHLVAARDKAPDKVQDKAPNKAEAQDDDAAPTLTEVRADDADEPADADSGKTVASATKKKAEPRLIRHKVVSGESLTRLAAHYQTTLAKLRDINNLDDDNVRIGQVLKVPAN